MPKIIYVEHSGVRHALEVPVGETLMAAARSNGVPGIIAECGGAAACATCRVQVDQDWAARLSAPEPLEQSMLDALEGEGPQERLSCQITCAADLDGLVVFIPKSQF